MLRLLIAKGRRKALSSVYFANARDRGQTRSTVVAPVISSRPRSQSEAPPFNADDYAVSFPVRKPAWASSASVTPTPAVLDRRVFSPQVFQVGFDYRPPERLSGRPARVVAPTPGKVLKAAKKAPPAAALKLFSPQTLMFSKPEGVVACSVRGRRKEVLFAKGQAGRRGRRGSPRRSYSSQFRC